ncbi:MAG: ATP-binding cassette domain-containing protein [Gammaproteobacteria bacterium]
MLNFQDVAIRRGPRLLFSEASFGLFRGEKIGITGENGSGKSSLMSLVRGELHADTGTFEMPSNLEIAHVSQELDATDQPAIEFVLDGDAPLRAIEREIAAAEARDAGEKLGELYANYAAAGGYDARSRAGRLLHGLGFSPEDETRAVREFSGGWRVRLNVAKALMCRSDLLLLDEPTNHLDLDAILWLEQWLRDYPGTLLLIAHDREFLDRVINRVVNIEHGKARAYRGNYSQFEDQRAAEMAEHASMYARQQREIKHMESFIERFRAQATKARQAQSRIKALERMARIAPAHVDSPFQFSFAQPDKLPKPLLALDKQSAGYGDRVILRNISLTLSPGDRIGLLGRNGAGKSTYMKLLAGELTTLSGTRTEARDLGIGYFAQHQLEQISVSDSPLTNLKRFGAARAARSTEQELRDYLGSFGFRGERVFEPIAPFSGGEKARLVLALVAYLRPNLMLLDEPTNHLDLEMRQALTMALQEYAGAVVLVSHDRHLLRTVADELYVVHDGRAEPFEGDLDDYAKWLAETDSASGKASARATQASAATKTTNAAKAATAPNATAGTAATAAAAGGANGDSPESAAPMRATEKSESAEERKQRKREEAERRNRLTPLRAAIEKCEKELERLARLRTDIQAQLESPEIYAESAKDRLRQLTEQQGRLTREVEQVEAQWLEHSERLENETRRA